MALDLSHVAYLAMDALPASVAVIDRSGVILWVNDSWRRVADENHLADAEYAVGSNYLTTCDAAAATSDEARLAAAELRELLAGDRLELALDYTWHSPSDDRRFRMLARPLDERAGGGAVIMHVDVSGAARMEPVINDLLTADSAERRALEQRMRELALYDALTGLPNRVLLYDRIEHALLSSSRGEGRLAALLIELAGFEELSERLGRTVGEELLVEAGRRLRPILRAGDTAARYSGDQFVALLLDIHSLSEAVSVAERISQALDRPFALSCGEVSIRATIGVASEWTHLHTADTLLEAADIALRRAGDSDGRIGVFENGIDHS